MNANHNLQPDELAYIENHNLSQHYKEYQQARPITYSTNAPTTNMTTLPEIEEVRFEDWLEPSAMSDGLDSATSIHATTEAAGTRSGMETYDVDWLEEQLDRGSTLMQDIDELHEMENILFSSHESSQQTYTTASMSASRSVSSLNSPATTNSSFSPSTSSHNSQPTSSSAPSPLISQQKGSIYPCTSCTKMFPKRHLLK